MDTMVNRTLVEAIDSWYKGKPIFSLSVDADNEQLVQELLFEICSDNITTYQFDLVATGRKEMQHLWPMWAGPTILRMSRWHTYTAEQVEATKSMAYKLIRYGYENCLDRAVRFNEGTVIEVKRNNMVESSRIGAHERWERIMLERMEKERKLREQMNHGSNS